MKIAYNGLFLTRPYTGIGQYTRHLLAAMAQWRPKDELTVFVPKRVTAALPGVRVTVVPPSRRFLGRGLALDRWETHDLAAAVRHGADLYHAPYPTPPLDAPIPTVMTVHDMIPWQLSEYRAGVRRRLKLARIFRGIQAADRICTVSETSKAAITRLTVVPPERVSVSYDGLDSRYYKPVTATAKREVAARHGLARPFVLYLGGYDRRKNTASLITAFAESGLAETHDLVLAGALTAPRTRLHRDFSGLPGLINRAGVAAAVRRIGFVAESDKPALTAAAAAFAYPSVAEGFGLPILEALAVGTPVVASDSPVNIELFAAAATLVDARRPDAFGQALRRVVTRPPRPAAGRKLAKSYSWERVADRTAAVYDDLLA